MRTWLQKVLLNKKISCFNILNITKLSIDYRTIPIKSIIQWQPRYNIKEYMPNKLYCKIIIFYYSQT